MKPVNPDVPVLPDELQGQIEAVIEGWFGIGLPNEASRRFIAGLAGTMPIFQAGRRRLVFEDEPASFEAALQATKEPT